MNDARIFILASILAISPTLVAASTPRFELLESRAALSREFCDTDFLNKPGSPSCMPPTSNQVLKIHFPLATAQLIARHVSQLEARRFFHAMNIQDFFHGHLINYGKTPHYAGLTSFLADITGYLYHTEEFTERWSQGNGRTPRSLLGKPDGSLIPAIEAVEARKLAGTSYETTGTINVWDIIADHPEMSTLQYPLSGESPGLRLTFSGSTNQKWDCAVDSMFLLRPEAEGRFHLSNGEAYDTYFLCVTDLPADPS